MNPHVWLRPANVFSWVYVCTFVCVLYVSVCKSEIEKDGL